MPIRLSQIRSKFVKSYFSRGKALFNDNAVFSFRMDDEKPHQVYLFGEVVGSASVYKQTINLKFIQNKLVGVFGDCSCPVGHNCKHVVAVCLEYYRRVNIEDSVPDSRFTEWLRKSESVVKLGLPSEKKQDWYTLQLFNELDTNHTYPSKAINEVDIFKHGLTARGNPAKPKKNKFQTLQNKVGRIANSQTVYMINLLESCYVDDWYSQNITFKNGMGFTVLSKLIKLGFAHFKMQEKPLVWEELVYELPIEFTDKNKQYHLSLPLDKAQFIVLCEPPILINSSTNQAQAVKTSLTGISLEQLFEMPVLDDLEQLDKVMDLYQEEFNQKVSINAQMALPLPQIDAFETIVIKDEVIPMLRLNNPDEFLFEVNFKYGDLITTPHDEGSPAVIKDKINGKRHEIYTNIALEKKYLKQMKQYLVSINDRHEMDHIGYFDFGDINLPLNDKLQKYIELQDVAFRILENSGWIVDFREDELLKIENVDKFSVESQPENDWFELSFNMTLGKEQYSMLPIMQYLLSMYSSQDELPEKIYIPDGIGKVLSFSKKQILPIFETFIQLYGSKAELPDTIKVQAFDAHLVHGLGNGEIQWKGNKDSLKLAEKLKTFKGISKVEPPKGLNAELRGYQQFGLDWLNFLREFKFNGILADDMGLGKTIQTLTWVLKLKETKQFKKPTLLIVPTSLIGNWKSEVKRFTPDLTVLTLHGSERAELFGQIKKHDIVITTYPLIVRDVEILKKQQFFYLVLDEAQKIKNPKTKLYQTLQSLKSKHRLCLTGTPIENHLGELWAIFNFLMPGFLDNYPRFKKHFQTPIEKDGKSSIQKSLTSKVSPFLLRRTKKEVLKELPDKNEIIKVTEFEPDQANLYETIRLTMETKIRETVEQNGIAKSQIMILDALLKLRQACCDPQLVKIDAAKKVKNSAKLEMLMDLVIELLEGDHKIILFSQFTSMLKIIEKRFKKSKIKYSLLTGQTKKREEQIEQFKNGETSIFLISLKAGGVGLNLTEADTVIHFDPWWNPAVENQATDRVYRIGQNKEVFVYKLIVANSIEEKIIEMQTKKQALQDQLFDKKGQKDQTKMTGEDLIGLLS